MSEDREGTVGTRPRAAAGPSGARALPALVVFDHDGVLVDSIGSDFEACRRLFGEHGVELPVERWAREVCGNTDGYDALFALLPAAGTNPARVAGAGRARPDGCPPEGVPDRYLWTRLKALWKELQVPENVPLMPGVRELLTRLADRGVRLAVASSADRGWVLRWLGHYGLTELFDTLVCGDDVPHRKPAPDVYTEAARRLGVPAARCLAVEDSLTGVTAARAAGMRVAAVPTSYTRSLDYGVADAVLTGLFELSDELLHELFREDDHV
ncbi:HAD family hydrolase [Streptomyces sp. NPDC001811]